METRARTPKMARRWCRLVAATCLLLGLCAVGGGCRSARVLRKDDLVTVYERPPLVPLEGASGSTILEFRGKKYKNLYSYSYVLVPELDGIIFATQREGRNIKLHFVPRQGSGEITIDEGDAYVFGSNLGLQLEYVESVADGTITFSQPPSSAEEYLGRTAAHRYALDLRARTFVEIRDGPSK